MRLENRWREAIDSSQGLAYSKCSILSVSLMQTRSTTRTRSTLEDMTRSATRLTDPGAFEEEENPECRDQLKISQEGYVGC